MGDSMCAMMSKVCVVCEQEFMHNQPRILTCSKECSRIRGLHGQSRRNKNYRIKHESGGSFATVSDCYKVIPLDPYRNEATDPVEYLPMTHVNNCIYPHP